jgi:glutathione S-transferase
MPRAGLFAIVQSGNAGNAKEIIKNLLISRLGSVADHLAAQPYLLGDQFSVADVYRFVTLTWGDFVGIELSKGPVLERYYRKFPPVTRCGQPCRKKDSSNNRIIITGVLP